MAGRIRRRASRIHPDEAEIVVRAIACRGRGHDLAVGLDGDVVAGVEAAGKSTVSVPSAPKLGIEGAVGRRSGAMAMSAPLSSWAVADDDDLAVGLEGDVVCRTRRCDSRDRPSRRSRS